MRWGLALSGGGAWGIANAGVLQVLDEHDLRPSCIAGSSMGAIVGSLYALGHPPTMFDDLLKQISLLRIAEFAESPLKGGFHGGLFRQRIEELLSPFLCGARISDCAIPFVCIAGRVVEPLSWDRALSHDFSEYVQECIELHIFPEETPIMDAILASSAIPVLFAPVEIGGDSFIDLCTFGAIPSRSLRAVHSPDVVIATKTAPTYDILRKVAPKGFRDFLEEGQASMQESIVAADYVIEPKLSGTVADFFRAKTLFDAGAAAARIALPEVASLVGN